MKTKKLDTKSANVKRLEQIPNVGPATAGDLRLLGIKELADLKGRDAFQMYEQLCRKTRVVHDPCVIDVFLAIIDFAETGKGRPWWKFTARRKKMLADRANRTKH